MPDDLATALDLPARAAAFGALDRISLTDHVVATEIGAFEAERGVPQRLAFDIVVEVAGQGPASDDVDRILSYDRLTEAVAAELGQGRVALLETLADAIAARILREPQAARVFLRIRKLDRGPGALGVEIVRARDAAPPPTPSLPLDAEVRLAPDDPAALLDAPRDRPLLLCPVAPPAPRAATPEAQRRVDLLALDQAAWLLAARAPRLLVAASLTEIDWALRRGHPVAWAPARLAVDAGLPADPPTLAAWIAARLGAPA